MLSLQGKQGAQKLLGSRVWQTGRAGKDSKTSDDHDDDLCSLFMCVGCGGRECVAWGRVCVGHVDLIGDEAMSDDDACLPRNA